MTGAMWEWWHPGGAPNRECQPGVPNLPAHIGNTTTQQIITQHILIFLAVQTFFVVIFLSGANTRERRGQVNSDLKTKI